MEMERSNDGEGPKVDEGRVELKRELGFFGSTSFIMGSIIGSGIFISPKGVLSVTGSMGLNLVVWAGAGIIALMGALCFCELGTLINRSGGEYTYLRLAYGNYLAFIFSWVTICLMQPSSLSVVALTFGTYFASVFETCGSPDLIVKMSAIACLLTLMLLNCYSVRMSAVLQIATTVGKVLALLIIIGGGIYKMAQGADHTREIQSGFEGSTTDPSTIALAFYDALWAYGGWNTLNQVAEEVQNPSKNFPRAIIISVVSIIVIYLLTNISYLTVMTKAELIAADAVAELWGQRVLHSASIIIPLSVMVSTLGAINGSFFAGARVTFTAARDGNLPEVLSFVNVKHNTPLSSMIFMIFLAIVYTWMGDISSLVDFLSFVSWLISGLVFISLIIFRFKYKNEPRTYKVPIILPVLMVLISLYLVIAPIVKTPAMGYLYAVLLSLSGTLFYVPFIYFQLKVPYIDEFVTYLQLIFEMSPTRKVD